MKKHFYLIMFLSWIGFVGAQSVPDKEKILHHCINLKNLELLYNQDKPLYILQTEEMYGNIHTAYKGQEVVFLSKDQLTAQKPDSYFSFWIFEANEKTARVLFAYNYDLNKPKTKDFKATLLMEKQGNEWIVTNTKLSW